MRPITKSLCFLLLSTAVLFYACNEVPMPVPNQPVEPPETTDSEFANPVIASGADPWVYFKDGFYYVMVTPSSGFGATEPSDLTLTIRKTRKMSELSSAPVTDVWRAPATGENSQNIWAPELHFLDGKWYIYYSADDGSLSFGVFALENESADPTTGTWVDKGRVTGDDFYAIDASVLEHPNGQRYFMWSGFRAGEPNTTKLYISEMSDAWTLTGPSVEISAPEYDWEKIGDPLPDVNEAPEALVRDGKVFIVYSASGCWTDDYALGLLTATEGGNPLNPDTWVKSPEPVFTKNPAGGAYGPGHNGFFKSVDGTEDWLIYHANAVSGGGCGESRSTRIQPYTWTADGVPDFGTPVSIFEPLQRPSGE